MESITSLQEAPNQLDNLQVDVRDLYERFPIHKNDNASTNVVPFTWSPYHKLYKCPLLPLSWRESSWRVARRVRLDATWFEEFKVYWSSVLGGRPLWGVDEFCFFCDMYRMKFQASRLPETIDPKEHLAGWQSPEVLYQLLFLIYRETVNTHLPALRALFGALDSHREFRLLEYGCGTAPVVASLYEFYRPGRHAVSYIADIQTVAFHYACYRFRRCSNVKPIMLRPENEFQLELDVQLDAIACMDVFEHMNKPLETVGKFHALLRTGGVLVFTYIKSAHAHGAYDTKQGVEQRDAVLDFIAEKFDVVCGQLDHEQSMGLTVVRKR